MYRALESDTPQGLCDLLNANKQVSVITAAPYFDATSNKWKFQALVFDPEAK